MKTRLILFAHNYTAQELLKTVSIRDGDTDDVHYMSIFTDSDIENIKRQVNLITDRTLILTDVYGGTPCNLSMVHYTPSKVEIVCGLNLIMLTVAIAEQHLSPLDLANAVIDATKQYSFRIERQSS